MTEMLLLQTTNNMAYQITSLMMTLTNLQGYSPIASLSNMIICTAVQQLPRFRQTKHVV